MKGLAGSAGAMAVIALGLFPGSNGESLRQDGNDHGPTRGVDAIGSPSTNSLDSNGSRRLQRHPRPRPATDDALDVNGTVSTDTLDWCVPYYLGSAIARVGSVWNSVSRGDCNLFSIKTWPRYAHAHVRSLIQSAHHTGKTWPST